MFQTRDLTDEQVFCLEHVLDKEYRNIKENLSSQVENDESEDQRTIEQTIVTESVMRMMFRQYISKIPFSWSNNGLNE